MKLLSVTLRNFRCYCSETTMTFDDLTTIIGRNDVGKSSILEALEMYFNNDLVKIESNDCSVSSDDATVEITCEFSELPANLILDAQAETSLSAEYMLTQHGNLRVQKRYDCSKAKPKEEVVVIAHHPTADQYNDLLTLNNTSLKKRYKDLGIDDPTVHLNSNPSIRRAIWSACLDLELAQSHIPVAKEDGKRIWDKLSEHLPTFAMFQSDRPSRDSDSEVQDPMKLAVLAALSEPPIQAKLGEVVDAVREKAVELAERTHRTLSQLDPALAGELLPEFKADPKWAGLFSLTLNTDDGIPLNKRGSGVRRMILVSFFRAEAERRLSERTSSSIIYAIEEPETSQHPSNQRILLESFQDLASEAGCQVILTTHSPGFASYLPVDSLRFIQSDMQGDRVVEQTSNATWEAIAGSLGVSPDNRIRALICVEGPNDVKALECLSHALHLRDSAVLDLSSDPRIAFVVLGGGSLTHWVTEHYLRGLGRPEIHIYDNDVDRYQKAIDKVNQRDDGSWGVLTSKLEIENYLHPTVVQVGLRLDAEVAFGDDDDLPAIIREKKGWRPETTKQKLAQYAFPRMTAELLEERDPRGEVKSWLERIQATL